jgi:hypothetical protein
LSVLCGISCTGGPCWVSATMLQCGVARYACTCYCM